MHRNNKFNKDGIVYSFFYFKQIYSQPTRDLYQKFPCIFPRMCTYRMLHPFQGKLLQTTNQQSQLSQRFFAILVLFLLQTTHKLLLHLDMNGDRPNLRPVRSLSSSRASSMTFDNFIISVRQQSVTQLITFSEPFLELTRSTGNRIGVSKDGAIIFTFSVLLKLRIDRLHNRALLNTISWRGYLHYCHLFNIHVSPYTLPALNPSLERHPTKHQSWYGRLVRKRYSNISNDTFPDTANP